MSLALFFLLREEILGRTVLVILHFITLTVKLRLSLLLLLISNHLLGLGWLLRQHLILLRLSHSFSISYDCNSLTN